MSQELLEIQRVLENLIRFGVVSEVDHANARCKVKAGDNDTDWLPWLVPRAGELRREWDPLSVGEQVVLLSPGGDPRAGVVIPAIYTNDSAAPSSSGNQHVSEYKDAARIEYDADSSTLTIEKMKDINIRILGDVNLIADGKIVNQGQTIHLNGGTGVCTGETKCHFTGLPHADVSTVVFAGKVPDAS